MQRCKTSTAIASKPAYTSAGTPGYFTSGNPASATYPTVPGADWHNMIQEEIVNVILAAGVELSAEDDAQLNAAIDAKIAAATPEIAVASTTEQGIVELATDAEAIAGTDTERAVTPAGLAAVLGASNLQEAFIGGGAMWASVTNGASPGIIADATNNLTRAVMQFKGTANDTNAEFDFRMPANWNRGTIKAKVMWTPATGASAGDNVRFNLAAVAVSDDDPLDAAPGTAVTMDDVVLAVGDLHVTPASDALTIAGTPQVGDLLRFKLTRDYDYGASPMAEDAQVLGVVLQYTTTGTITAW